MTRLSCFCIWLLCVLLLAVGLGDAYKYLVVFPLPGKSHGILGDGHVRLLLDAGHEVTYITAYPGKHSHPNYSEVDISACEDIIPKNVMNLKAIMDNEVSIGSLSLLFNITSNLAKTIFQIDSMKKIMNDPGVQFDAVIVEWMFTEIYSGLSVVFDCPFIWFTSTEPTWMQLSLIDDHVNPAYSTDPMSTAIPPFNFKRRVVELWNQILGIAFKNLYLTLAEKALYEELYGPILKKKGRSLPPYHEVRYNASIMLGNSHVSLGSALRHPQSYKPIGGYHIDPKIKPLPTDLQKHMDNANHGVIYFSMGSNLQSKDMPQELKQSLLRMFGELKYTVIWKFEELLSNVPNNVHIVHWAPQTSILSHPNCILFITHGGLLSTTETLHFGVPTIGIPTFGDQFLNVVQSVNKGYARKVDLKRTMAADLRENIDEILGNPRYSLKAKEWSAIYHDRPVSPGAELVHWTEHVARTRGAPHLRSPALSVPLYQKLYLDLIGLLLAAFYLVWAALKKLLCSNTKRVTNESKKKKN